MYDVERFGGEVAGHEVVLEFDTRRVVLNQANLLVDGDRVDTGKVFYGDKQLRTTLDDGTEVEVALHSGMAGELTRAQLRQADGSWRDLTKL
ncbi:hypothetical protein DVA67_022220 [Solirubrobacter sp. CPCC 204708]|uniref:DUF5666 domain-containing protein n=1 Tax=Solirubrobacter deserti TaxID=2282478 RepID=A0ABT4RRT7_9ACTN|nr:hypothetical protein [Solirubrobacter deserti]MBE2318710.1 hypothetical protein [Solirubrobacter deserti]MDA0141300.1 hypothetical protein [Solirubrobacter deserti]